MMSHLSHEIFNHPIKALVDEALSPAHRAQCVSVLPRQQQALQEALLSSLPADEQPKSGGQRWVYGNQKEPDIQLAKVRDGSTYHRL